MIVRSPTCSGSTRLGCCVCSWAPNCGCNYARVAPSQRSSSTERASTSTLPDFLRHCRRCSEERASTASERWRSKLRGGRAELAVAGIAEAGHDEGVGGEMVVDGGGVDRQGETGRGEGGEGP